MVIKNDIFAKRTRDAPRVDLRYKKRKNGGGVARTNTKPEELSLRSVQRQSIANSLALQHTQMNVRVDNYDSIVRGN